MSRAKLLLSFLELFQQALPSAMLRSRKQSFSSKAKDIEKHYGSRPVPAPEDLKREHRASVLQPFSKLPRRLKFTGNKGKLPITNHERVVVLRCRRMGISVPEYVKRFGAVLPQRS